MQNSDSSYPRLLADVGGTNARFAWSQQPNAPLSNIHQYSCHKYGSLQLAIAQYLADHGKPSPASCGIGIANPVTGDQVSMTNHDWSFSISALKKALAVSRLAVVNDFTALALSLPMLAANDLRQIGSGKRVAGEALGVIGPGTGLGVSGLLSGADGVPVAVAGEGGHSTLAANDDLESDVIALLRKRFGHVSAERVLSGPGLVNLYEACAQLDKLAVLRLAPQEVIARARADEDRHCQMALELFCRFLGGMAGNLALTLGARGGIYIGGGIAPRLLPELAKSGFRERFEGKGRYQKYLADIPTFVIDAVASPALLGASRALDIERFCNAA
jgi:glucokinase